MRIDFRLSGEAVIAGQDGDQRLFRDDPVGNVRSRLAPEEAQVDLPALQCIPEIGRIEARQLEFDRRQFGAQYARDVRQPVHLLPGEEANREDRLGRPCRAAGRLDCFRSPTQRQSRMIKEGASQASVRCRVRRA